MIVTNEERAERARLSVAHFAQQVGITDEEPKIQFGDLLANLVHWGREEGVDVSVAVRAGLHHAFCEIVDPRGNLTDARHVSRHADELLDRIQESVHSLLADAERHRSTRS